MEALPAYTFKWDVMKDVYPENATSKDASADVPIDISGLAPGADYRLEVVYWSLEQGIEDLDGTGDDHTAGKEVIFVDQNATAITTIHQSPLTSQPTYNLRGERVNGSYRGIVIRNGKKYVVK